MDGKELDALEQEALTLFGPDEVIDKLVTVAREAVRLRDSRHALREALDLLVCIVGLTAFKYEGQRAPLQEALDMAVKVLKSDAAAIGSKP